MRTACDVEQLAPVTAFLVWASVADLCRALQALGAVNVLHLFAVSVAVAVAASAARGTFARTVIADARKPAVCAMDALVVSSVSSLEAFICVFSDLPCDGGQAHADVLCHGSC